MEQLEHSFGSPLIPLSKSSKIFEAEQIKNKEPLKVDTTKLLESSMYIF